MKLVSKQVVMDENTFAPVLRVVVDLPIEIVQSDIPGDTSAAEYIGSELIRLIREK